MIDSTEACSSADCTNRSTKVDTLARSSAARIGAKMKSTAPLAYAVAVSVSSRPNAVRKMIGVSFDRLRCRISAAVSNPSSVGIRTSIRITAKFWRSTARSAARPESASTTAWPSGASMAPTASRSDGLSSTTRTAAWARSASLPTSAASLRSSHRSDLRRCLRQRERSLHEITAAPPGNFAQRGARLQREKVS